MDVAFIPLLTHSAAERITISLLDAFVLFFAQLALLGVDVNAFVNVIRYEA